MYKILLSKYFKISTNSLPLPLSLYYKKRRINIPLPRTYTITCQTSRLRFPPVPNVPASSASCSTRYSRQTSRNDSIHTHRYKSLERIPPFFSTTAPMKYSYSAGIYNPRYRFLMGEKGQTCCDRNC